MHTHTHSHNTLTLGNCTEAPAIPHGPDVITSSHTRFTVHTGNRSTQLTPTTSASINKPLKCTSPMTSQKIAVTSPTGLGHIQVPAGLYLREEFLPLPQCMVDKIARFEYVEMAELQPEAWLLENQSDTKYCLSIPKPRRPPVTDVLTWVQCFTSLGKVHGIPSHSSHIR